MAKKEEVVKIVDDHTLKEDIDYYFKKTSAEGAHKWAEDIIQHIAGLTNKSSKVDYPRLHKALIPLKYYDDNPKDSKNLKRLKQECKDFEEYLNGVTDRFDHNFQAMALACMKSSFSKPDALLTSVYAVAVINTVTDNEINDAKTEREWQFEKLRSYAKF